MVSFKSSCALGTLNKDSRDLIHGIFAEKVSEIVYMHQVAVERWVTRQIAKSVFNVAADVGIECDSIHIITSFAIWMLDGID